MIVLQPAGENEIHNGFNQRNLDFLTNSNNNPSIGNFTPNAPQTFPSQMYQTAATSAPQYQSQPSYVYSNSHLNYPSNANTSGQSNPRSSTTSTSPSLLSRQSNSSASNNHQSMSNSSTTSDQGFVPTNTTTIDPNGYHSAHLGYRYDNSSAVVAAVSTATNTASSSACSSPSIATTTLTSTAAPSPNSTMNHPDFSKNSPITNNQVSPINNHSVLPSGTTSNNTMSTENVSNILPPLSQVFPSSSSSINNNNMTIPGTSNSTVNSNDNSPIITSSPINNATNIVSNLQQHHHNNNHHHSQQQQQHQHQQQIHNHHHQNSQHHHHNHHQSSHSSNTNNANPSSNIQLSTANFLQLQSMQQQYSDVNAANYAAAAAQASDTVTYAPQLISQAQHAAAAAALSQQSQITSNMVDPRTLPRVGSNTTTSDLNNQNHNNHNVATTTGSGILDHSGRNSRNGSLIVNATSGLTLAHDPNSINAHNAAINYQQQQAAAAAVAQHQALLHNHFMAAAHSLTNGGLIATANSQRTAPSNSQSPNGRRIINNNGMIVGGDHHMSDGCGNNVDMNSQSHDHQHNQQQQQQQQQQSRPPKVYSFVALPGINTKKRPRRRYDEIERHYSCNFPGCTKSYGTLNHLNAHVQMQKHGPKRHPSEFKELRKQWRRQKREEEERKAAENVAAKNHSNLNMSI